MFNNGQLRLLRTTQSLVGFIYKSRIQGMFRLGGERVLLNEREARPDGKKNRKGQATRMGFAPNDSVQEYTQQQRIFVGPSGRT